jgi:hypothetical protein
MLSSALGSFCAADGVSTISQPHAGLVHVYAAQLGVQRDHITLECLPAISTDAFVQLQAATTMLAQEFAADGLTFSASISRDKLKGGNSHNHSALGTLNLSAELPLVANFIGRDIAKALPRDAAARVLRQFVNGAQMVLHQTPVQGCVVNSVWCSHALPTDALSSVWLQEGLTQWWDALPDWDSALDLTSLNSATRLELIYSDKTVVVSLKRRSAWALWLKPLVLESVLSA